MRLRGSCVVASAIIALFAGTAVQGALITGKPAADGWTNHGTSLDNGVYIRGSGNFAYDVYSTSTTLDPSSPLIASTALDTGFQWLPGDTILGVGGIIKAPETPGDYGWGSISGDPINSNISLSIRVVGKFGTSPTAWTKSTTSPVPGNGLGSSSSGHGGNGTILFGNPNPGVGTQLHDLAAEGTFYIPSVATQYRTSVDANISGKAGRMIWDLNNSSSFLESWETILNVSLLQRNAVAFGYVGADYPQSGDRGNVALQRSNSTTLLTDALVPVPEPGGLAILGLASLTLVRRRRAE